VTLAVFAASSEIALAAAIAADGKQAAPPAVHLMPLGVWKGKDGRGPYRNDKANAARVVAETKAAAAARPLPIDYDHAMDLALGARVGAPAPAAGWIVDVELREDGIWGTVEWTDSGGRAVASREYRFISPVFDHDSDGTVRRISHAGLTNNPNFTTLVAVASAASGSEADPKTEKDKPTMELLQQLVALLGLAAGATPADVVAAVKAMIDKDASATAATKTAAASLGLGTDAELAAVLTAAIAKADKNKSATGDTATAIASLNATVADLNKQLVELKAGKAGETAQTAVASAMAAGKVAPAAKDWALDYATKDPQGFATYVAKMPAVLTPGTDTPAVASATGADGLTAAEREVADGMGISHADFAKAKKTA
jgi:phage I-like protein